MKKLEEIVNEVAEIYRRSGNEAEEYLRKARGLKEKLGPGLAIIYCWFYSVPQKWTQVEPKVFELMKITNSFDLDTMLTMSKEDLARALRPMLFYNEISLQLKNFCKAIQDEYGSWKAFAEAIEKQHIFSIFKKLRKHRGIRLTFKNLAAMKSFVGLSNDLLVLDTHVAKVLGISKDVRNKYNVQEKLFKDLLIFSNRITIETWLDRLTSMTALEREGFQEITTIQWSLAIWFNKAKIRANDLLPQLNKTSERIDT